MFILKNVCFRDIGKTFAKFQRYFQKILPKRIITNTQYLTLIWLGGVILPPPIGFPLITQNGKIRNPGILQHLVTFY